MAFQNNNFQGRTFTADTVTFDQGLRRHMIGVYNHMTLGLVLTGLAAWFTAHNAPLMQMLYGTPLRFLVVFAPLAFVLVLSFGIQRLSSSSARLIFYGYSAVMGLSLASLFLAYPTASLSLVFFITASTFASMSLYGYVTKSNLTGMGSFMRMGVFGILIAMIANWFMHSSELDLAISVLGVIVFTGLTAYDTQRIRNQYSEGYGVETNSKLAIMGALSLYLDFVNMFLFMLRLFGGRR